jgi:hypothetical protein
MVVVGVQSFVDMCMILLEGRVLLKFVMPVCLTLSRGSGACRFNWYMDLLSWVLVHPFILPGPTEDPRPVDGGGKL